MYLLFSTLSIHHFGLWLDRLNKDRDKEVELNKENKKEIKKNYIRKKMGRVVFLAVLIHIGLLVCLKYTGFFGENINNLLEILNVDFRFKIPKILIPIGISFILCKDFLIYLMFTKGKLMLILI